MTGSIRSNSFVTDTMALVLRMEKRKLSAKVKDIFDNVEEGKYTVYIPAIVISEILYLSEKKRIRISVKDVADYLLQYPNYKEQPLNFPIIQAATGITDIRELHDRLIAATALYLNLELITNDPVIETSEFVNTLW
ncbi:MAG: type II toxin-antitoxin system VapC family toxin [Candidatus Omnitrophota bacterium]